MAPITLSWMRLSYNVMWWLMSPNCVKIKPYLSSLQYHQKCIQCEHCQMQKSIKLLLLDASSLWPGINLLLKYYVWHFLYQNFIGLSWIVCPQHQIEVKEAFQEKVTFSSNSSFSIREVFLPYVLIWRWLEP